MNRHEYEILLIKEIGKTLKKLRHAKNMSQLEVSKGICNKATISDIENGIQKIPNVIMLSKIAKKLNVNLADIIKISENNISDLSIIIKKRILNFAAYGKYNEAKNLLKKHFKSTKLTDYKYDCYISGVECFYQENYLEANRQFLNGLYDLKNINEKEIICFIDIFLLNGYIGNLFKLSKIDNNFIYFTSRVKKLLYILKNSIEYYLIFEINQMVRMQIHLIDHFRLFGIYEVCETLIIKVEKIVFEYSLHELKVDLAYGKILYFSQINKKPQIKNIVEKTKSMLQAYDLTELEIYFDKRIIELIQELKYFNSSFN